LHTITVGSEPIGVAIDKSGNVWVVNGGSDTVTKITASLTTAPTFPTSSHSPTLAPTYSPEDLGLIGGIPAAFGFFVAAGFLWRVRTRRMKRKESRDNELS
jgi:hypothetical protein